jgi:hypothetical protein
VKLIWVERAKNNELKDVVGFIADIVLLTILIPLVKISKKQLQALKQFFVHCANSYPNLVSL